MTRIFGRVLPVLVWALALTAGVHAQDYRREQPKMPPATPPAAPPVAPLPPGSDDRKILVDKLQAVVFVDDEKKVQAEPPRARGVVTHGVPLLQQPGFDQVVAPYLGKPLSLASLSRMVKEIVLWCRAEDRPVIDVIVPQQDITGGVLQLVFLEGRVGRIEAEGNRWFSSRSLVDQIRLQPGDEIGARKLAADVNWINQNPFRDAGIVFVPGNETGRTDLIVQTKDRFPLRVYTGYENSGNAITGEDRYEAGFNWGDAFFLGQQLNYQFTTSGDARGLLANSGSYVVPLPWRHTLTLFGVISSSQADINNNSNLDGSGAQLGLRYDIPLPGVDGVYTHDFQFGYDWKQSDNALEFGVIPVNDSLTDVGQFVFAYNARIADPWGVTTVAPQVFWSPGDWWDNQNQADYQLARPGASPDYAYGRLDVARFTHLPWNFSLNNEFIFQASDGNLLPSEQLEFGGASSVRGYEEYDLNGTDRGWVLRNELRFPPVSPARLCGVHAVSDQLQLLAFFDCGEAESHQGQITLNNGKAVDTATMAAVGPGIRYTIDPYLSVRADYGVQLIDTGDRHASRWSLSAVLSY